MISNKSILVSDIAEMLHTTFHGNDFQIQGVSSSNDLQESTLAFVRKMSQIDDLIFNEVTALVLVDELPRNLGRCSFIVLKNPRLGFAQISSLLKDVNKTAEIHQTAVIADEVKIGVLPSIGAFVVIEDDVIIGDNVVLESGVTLKSGVRIGDDCRIKTNTVIGTDGFGFEFSEIGQPTRIHHFGGVTVGNNVEIGCNCVIAKGTIDDTCIENDVKIDDLVFIAHNVKIGERSVVIANSEISGSVTIGSDCWISPHVTVLNKVSIGDKAFIGIGSVVIRDVDRGSVVVGNPAKFLKTRE
jgi:UDP-3-O-[3-hydroxymyristoyl] glucosamine N-acyltransferase LpxD